MEPPPSSSGKKRALPLDLNDIARAILNLPTDSSAVLPSPSPFPLSFERSASEGHAVPAIENNPNNPNNPTPTQPTASRVHRVIRQSMRIANRRIKRDIDRGNLTAKQMHEVLCERRAMYNDWHRLHAENRATAANESLGKGKGKATDETGADFQKVDEAWMVRNTFRAGFVNSDNPDMDSLGRPAQVLIQRIADRDPSQTRTVGEPGAIYPWTKYFKSVDGLPGQSGIVQPALAALPALPFQSPTPRSNKAPMGLGLQLLPAPKKRFISRSVSLGQPGTENYDSDDHDPQAHETIPPTTGNPGTGAKFDLISSISSCPELIMHVCGYMGLSDILALYRVSRVFKSTFDSDLEKNVQRMARQFASAETRSIFSWRRVTKTISPLSYIGRDPQSPWTREFQGRFPQAPSTPGLRYVGMLASRERKVRDIVAVLARAGHRLPRTNATAALKKMWLLMDIPTNSGRVLVLKDEELFSDLDLLTIQMFHVKLVLHFHDPLFGPDDILSDLEGQATNQNATQPLTGLPGSPGSPQDLLSLNISDFFGDSGFSREDQEAAAIAARNFILMHQRQLPEHSLVETLLGQRGGFDVLWNMLRGKAYRTMPEVIQLKARYDCKPPAAQDDAPVDCHPGWENLFTAGDATQGSATSMDGTFGRGNMMSNDVFAPAGGPGQGPVPRSHKPVVSDTLVDVHGTAVPRSKMGRDHLEGGGKGSQHLLRPDELVSLEAARRVQDNPDDHFDLSSHVPFMAVWGARDFATGGNMLPDVDEMYMSDDEYDIAAAMGVCSRDDKDDDHDHDKENQRSGASASHAPLSKTAFPTANAVFAQGLGVSMFPMPEVRLQQQIGNVLTGKHEWPPCNVLKMRWETLTLQEKLDLWWISHQERMHRQAWTVSGENDRRNGHGGASGQNLFSEISYTLPDFPISEAGDADADADGGDNDGGRGADVVEDVDMEDFDDPEYFAEDEEDGDDEHEHGTSPPSTPPAETDFQATTSGGGSSSNSAADIPLPDTAKNLPKRHQRLMQSCIQWAMREQDEVDEALLAQADMTYGTAEMAHWDEFLAAADQALALEGVDLASLDNEINNDGWMSEGYSDEGLVPNPEEVLMPEYGGMNDVIRLVQQIHEAAADVDAAQFAARIDAPLHDVATAAAAERRLAELKHTVDDLVSKLEIMIEAEVFAIEL